MEQGWNTGDSLPNASEKKSSFSRAALRGGGTHQNSQKKKHAAAKQNAVAYLLYIYVLPQLHSRGCESQPFREKKNDTRQHPIRNATRRNNEILRYRHRTASAFGAQRGRLPPRTPQASRLRSSTLPRTDPYPSARSARASS